MYRFQLWKTCVSSTLRPLGFGFVLCYPDVLHVFPPPAPPPGRGRAEEVQEAEGDDIPATRTRAESDAHLPIDTLHTQANIRYLPG